MSFDMSDPHRVTRRSHSPGFWLHVIAAPAIVNTVALTLFQIRNALGRTVGLLDRVYRRSSPSFAIAIDRRSFLVSGVGYVVALGPDRD
jgi:selenocysteine-specific translation elongation factor